MNRILAFSLVTGLFAAGFLNCNGPFYRVVKHPEDIRIYHDRLPLRGQKYNSLGVINAHRTRLGGAFLFWGWDWLWADRHAYTASTGGVSAEMQTLLNETLVRKAREVGATALIGVRYYAAEYGICLPLWGPLTYRRFFASAEAVKQ